MPVLVYCITEAQSDIEVPKTGVRSMPITIVVAEALKCFVSKFEPAQVQDKASIREAALDFHRTVREVFQQTAVLPFRFPAVLANENEVAAHLRQHSTEYASALSRLRSSVQMEIRIEEKRMAQAPGASGSEYLRQKQLAHTQLQERAAQFRQASEPWTEQWRMHETSGGVRCYVLLRRESIGNFLQRVKGVVLPANHSARVSGPWPATEFFKAPE